MSGRSLFRPTVYRTERVIGRCGGEEGGSGVRGFPRGYVDSGKRADVSRVLTTAIIHAGRVSLDEKRSVELVEEGGKWKMV